ncbi:MAG: hypothetical protein LBI18_09975 [Planctomycetaceae bacterium]|nr:hypothetical protein [Planctomycetaceae bacterium]
METYIADKYCPETRYQLRLDTHADQRYGNGRMDIFSLPIARKEMVDFLAAEIVAFLELLPPTRESKPTKGILDKQLHGTTPFYFLYCPACRKQHTIQPDDFNNGWKRYWFQCEFCNHSVEFEKALFVEGVLPTQHKPKLGRLRNKITLQEKSRFWEEYLVIHTKSHVGMLGFWVLPYLVGIIVGYALIVFGIFGLFAYLSFASGDYRPIYHSIPLAGIAVFLTTTWAIPCFIRNEFSRWKLEMSSSGIAYSFGLWNWTIRRRKHIETLKICRRNRNTVSVSSDDPLNPAGQCRHAVVLFDDDQVWGAIPCRDELEVDHIYNLLNQYWNSFTQNEKQKNESTC